MNNSVKERRWASIIAGILFLIAGAVQTLLTTNNSVIRLLTGLETPKMLLMILAVLFALFTLFIYAFMAISLFVGRRNILPLIPTVCITFTHMLSVLCNIVIVFKTFCFFDYYTFMPKYIDSISDFIEALKYPYFQQSLLDSIISIITLIFFAVLVLLNSFKKLRKKSAWTINISLLPGLIWILLPTFLVLLDFIPNIKYFELSWLLTILESLLIPLSLGLPMIFMGIWITSGARDDTVIAKSEVECEPVAEPIVTPEPVAEPQPIVENVAEPVAEPEPVAVSEEKETDKDLEVIKKYKKLLDAGVITQEEFEAKKNEYLFK